MKKYTAKAPEESSLEIHPLKRSRMVVRIIGDTPFWFNSMPFKAQQTLVLGGGRKTASERKEIKHNPEEEFQASVYRARSGNTLLCFPAPGIKQAMATAALQTPGVNKTDVKRLVFLPQEKFPVWGIPRLRMAVVRSADMARTPDIRTRACLEEWCAEIDIAFVNPALTHQSIVNLIANAGIICGIGDYRQEKGSGSGGTFSVVSTPEQEAKFKELVKNAGRAAQQEAFDKPTPYDEETAELWATVRRERMKRAAA